MATFMSELIDRALQLLYFMAPAYVANMAPPFVRYWRGWNRPIHAPSLGEHKTVLGFAFGVLAAVPIAAVQKALALPAPLVDYTHWPWIGLGFGIGAMIGDCVKSYFKRRRKIAPGAPWIPFDQLDFVLGSLLLVGPFAALSVADAVFLLAISLIGDILVNRIAFRLGIKTSPW